MNWRRAVSMLLIAICIMVFAVLAVAWSLAPHNRQVDVTGVVVDAKTGQPIPKAKVIVSLQRKGLLYEFNLARFGIFTDDLGRFSVRHGSPKPFHNLLIEASTPSNHYGYVYSSESETETIVKTNPLPKSIEHHWIMNYDRFGGAATGMGVKGIEFTGENWTTEKP